MHHPTDSITYHSLCYTRHESLAGTSNSSMGPPWRIDPKIHCIMSEQKRRKEMFYLTMHSTHFYSYMASDGEEKRPQRFSDENQSEICSGLVGKMWFSGTVPTWCTFILWNPDKTCLRVGGWVELSSWVWAICQYHYSLFILRAYLYTGNIVQLVGKVAGGIVIC